MKEVTINSRKYLLNGSIINIEGIGSISMGKNATKADAKSLDKLIERAIEVKSAELINKFDRMYPQFKKMRTHGFAG